MWDAGGKDHRIIDRTSSAVKSRRLRRLAALAVTATLATGASTALGFDGPSQMPAGNGSAPPADSGVVPTTAPAATTAPVAATAPAAPVAATTAGTLAFGAKGADVRSLQRKLRTRGIKVPVDGSYTRLTRAGVRILQRKWKMQANGVADAALLARLGIKVRAVASEPAAAAAPAATPTYTAQWVKTFPVVGPHQLTDSWGDYRGDLAGHSHQGNDIMAPKGTPTVAVGDGVIKRLTREETGLGGIWIWLRDTAGNEYYYAHLTDISAGLDAGSKVTAGQIIGTVGNTGDARSGDPHLHFEIHPGGGGAVDPYKDLLAVDPFHGKAG